MFWCLTASTARALLCMADVEFGIQVMVEAVVACPEPEHCHLFPPGSRYCGRGPVKAVTWLSMSYTTPLHTSCVGVRWKMSYTTPLHTSCVGVRWKMCTAYTASFPHILKKVTFDPLLAIANAFNICIFEREFSCFFRGVGLGASSAHHCHQEVRG